MPNKPTLSYPDHGIDDNTHDKTKKHVVLNEFDEQLFQRLIWLVQKKWPELKGKPLFDIAVLCTHTTFGAHSDKPLNDGPGDIIVSISIQGSGCTMDFLHSHKPGSILQFPLQHGDMVMFQKKPRYNLRHQINVPDDGTIILTLLILNTLIIHMPTTYYSQSRSVRKVATCDAGRQ